MYLQIQKFSKVSFVQSVLSEQTERRKIYFAFNKIDKNRVRFL